MQLIDFLFPQKCHQCGKVGAQWCDTCIQRIPSHTNICYACQKISVWWKAHTHCLHELAWVRVSRQYTTHLQHQLKQAKYHHKRPVLTILWNNFASRVPVHYRDMLITYVPTTRWRKHIIKWYNQSEILAYCIWNVQCIFKKNRTTLPQASLKRKQRIENVQWAYSLIKNLDGINDIAIVDDVISTWSTLIELAKIIHQMYPHIRVRWIILTRHQVDTI